ncbi:MAG: Na(+)/H(+) antiporter subunit B [Spirochaetota bacterium]
MITVLLFFIIIGSAYALFSRDLLHSTIVLSMTSVVSALIFYLLHAPDVAITEAAVGAGLSTVVFIWIIKHTKRSDP